jgi:LmbE family N-acetylglucosaminyl deacetylase
MSVSSILTRRSFGARTMTGLVAMGLQASVQGSGNPSGKPISQTPLRIVCVGAHCDDPESGCGGTLARYAELGHHVTIVYLTTNEAYAGFRGRPREEVVALTRAESEAACKILGAKAVFVGQIDGASEVTPDRTRSFCAVLAAEFPDIVFTHWPIDAHHDHQTAGLLTLRTYKAAARKFRLFFYEVERQGETMCFSPTTYVDITTTREKKKASLRAHRSVNGEMIYKTDNEVMESFRGSELGVKAAEAFIELPLVWDPRAGMLPGLDDDQAPLGHSHSRTAGEIR